MPTHKVNLYPAEAEGMAHLLDLDKDLKQRLQAAADGVLHRAKLAPGGRVAFVTTPHPHFVVEYPDDPPALPPEAAGAPVRTPPSPPAPPVAARAEPEGAQA